MERYDYMMIQDLIGLGETPSHWNVLRMCYMFKPVSIKTPREKLTYLSTEIMVLSQQIQEMIITMLFQKILPTIS